MAAEMLSKLLTRADMVQRRQDILHSFFVDLASPAPDAGQCALVPVGAPCRRDAPRVWIRQARQGISTGLTSLLDSLLDSLLGLCACRRLTEGDVPTDGDNLTDGHDSTVCRVFRVTGILATLARLFKASSRPLMLPLTPTVWQHTSRLLPSKLVASHVIARKLCMKVAQRVALTLLDPTRINATAAAVRANRARGAAPPAAAADEEVLALTAQGMAVIPAVIDTLLTGLRDSDTVVRWSAACLLYTSPSPRD